MVWAGLLGPPGLSIPNFSFAYGWGRELVSSFCFARTSLLSNKSINLFFLSILKLATYCTPHWAICFYFGYFHLEISRRRRTRLVFPLLGGYFLFSPWGLPCPFRSSESQYAHDPVGSTLVLSKEDGPHEVTTVRPPPWCRQAGAPDFTPKVSGSLVSESCLDC